MLTKVGVGKVCQQKSGLYRTDDLTGVVDVNCRNITSVRRIGVWVLKAKSVIGAISETTKALTRLLRLKSIGHSSDFAERESRQLTVCAPFLASIPLDKFTPQKLFSGSSSSTPAWTSFGESCRIHPTRNSFFFAPRCKIMIIPDCNDVWYATRRAPVGVMSTVCAKRVTEPTETFTGNTIFLRSDFLLFSIATIVRDASSEQKVTRVIRGQSLKLIRNLHRANNVLELAK